jgi:mRNA interferase HicA
VYNILYKGECMKRKDLIKRLEHAGFIFERHGGSHDVYVRGDEYETIPRHKEINERLARAILRRRGLS